MKKRLKINGVIIFFAVLMIAFFPRTFLRQETVSSWDELAKILGVVFILFGQILRVSARGYKSEHSKEGHILIQGGPYALVRNPMYLGILFIGLGIVLMLFQWWVACIFLLIFIIRYLLLIFREEKKLAAAFPRDYPDYRQRVPRLLPSIPLLWKKDISEYFPLKLSWLKKEIGSILAVLLIALFVESWRDIKTVGLRGYFRGTTIFLVIIILFICIVIYLCKRTVNLGKDVSNKSKNN